ncbi:hypothetical protein E5Q_03068 [Mixia osmundae IAM 14324]|uniref:Clu domain-containing protein n=1 Tax=Mixia osmundae (strain CBS 9802 / IAM 14324 / JCM 22182 / KY 12970) TaxID=764103 RepID=G7E0P1_MIXOS|nr:hypothetical protein E5Q_03068 [Mixia osmundae IAM 14324]
MTDSEETGSPTLVNGDIRDAVAPAVADSSAAEQQASSDEVYADQYELTLLLPRKLLPAPQDWGIPPRSPDPKVDPDDEHDLENYVRLWTTVAGTENIRDIRSLVSDSAEGFWLGSFGFVKVDFEETPEDEQPKRIIPESDSTPFPELAELPVIFPGTTETKQRVLKVVPVDFTEAAARQHLMQFWDVINHRAMALTGKNVYRAPKYDPSTLTLEPGMSLFTSVRGQAPEEPECMHHDHHEAHCDAHDESADKKKSEQKKTKARQPELSEEQPAPTDHVFENFEPLKDEPWRAILSARDQAARAVPQTPAALRQLAVSAWNPPPLHLAQRGHLLYVTLITLEGENVHVQATNKGFYIDRSDSTRFDPTPKSSDAPFATLYELCRSISRAFSLAMVKIVEPLKPLNPDMFAYLPISLCTPASPWLVSEPSHTADPLRNQLAYIVTGGIAAEQLPPARDWNDDFVSVRELPVKTLAQRVLRERNLARLHYEFEVSATRTISLIMKGEIPAINPSEGVAARTYLYNNVLFLRALDALDIMPHLGGDEASRVAANKDLEALKVLHQADIPQLNLIGTALVDLQGQRWVCQTLPPGIANKTIEEIEASKKDGQNSAKEEDDFAWGHFRILYGSSDTEKADDELACDPKFHKLASKVGEALQLAPHIVQDKEGRQCELYTSMDVHGAVGLDGRPFLMDLARTSPVDVHFLEDDIQRIPGETEDCAYPHTYLLLRRELLDAYRDSSLRQWLTEQVAKKTAQKPKPDEEPKTSQSTAVQDEPTELALSQPPTPTVEESVTSAPTQAEREAILFNVDAFVKRQDDRAGAVYQESDPAVRHVRQASKYLREVALVDYLTEIVANGSMPVDGAALTSSLHARGINMRYLGHIVRLAQAGTHKIPCSPSLQLEAADQLAKVQVSLKREMVVRAAKHILRAEMSAAQPHQVAEVAAHNLSCLLGAASTSTTSSQTKETIQTAILRDVARRFRFRLEPSYFDQELARPQLLRELCYRLGIQLKAQPYAFDTVPTSNGAYHSSEDEATKTKKPKAKATNGVSHGPLRTASIMPDDILGFVPVVKSVQHQSGYGTYLVEQAQFQLLKGDNERGEPMMNDAVHYYEQLFGNIHPEIATKYHQMSVVYSNIAQPLLRRVSLFEQSAQLSKPDEAARMRAYAGVPDEATYEAIKRDSEIYLDAAARMERQAILAAERTLGVDHSLVAPLYGQLALHENALGNTQTALRLTKHAIGLYQAQYGPGCTEVPRQLTHAAAFIQGWLGHEASIPYYKAAHASTVQARGPESIATGTASYAVAQVYALSGNMKAAIEPAKESARIFAARLGEKEEKTLEANNLLAVILANAANQAKAEQGQAASIARRLHISPERTAQLLAQARNGMPIESVQAEAPTGETYGSRGHLAIDDLVKYISGQQQASKTTSSKQRRQRGGKTARR